jgi:hypothetical protein
MPDCYDALQIQPVAMGEHLQIIGGMSDIQEGARPATSWVAYASVFDIPCRYPALYKILRQSGHKCKPVWRSPEATMNEDHNRMWTGVIRHI